MTAPHADFRKKIAVLAAVYIVLLVGGGYFGARISQGFDITIWPHTEPTINRLIVTGIFLYIVLTAIPFVPGVELGLALIFAFGVKIVPVVYFATIAALVLSFAVGRLIPDLWLAAGFRWLAMGRAAAMVEAMARLESAERVDYLMARAPKRWLPWLLRHRLFTLAVLFNLPGSSLLGGGGGIAMMAGISRLMTFPKFLLSAAVAVAPVPAFLLLSSAIGAS
jgi:hypothetical protein